MTVENPDAFVAGLVVASIAFLLVSCGAAAETAGRRGLVALCAGAVVGGLLLGGVASALAGGVASALLGTAAGLLLTSCVVLAAVGTSWALDRDDSK